MHVDVLGENVMNHYNLKQRQSGFTLIELMITVGILATLLSIAVPSYNSYVVRAKVSEGLSMLSESKTRIATFYGSTGQLPQNFYDLGFGEPGGSAHGGDAGSFESVYGFDSDMWRKVEWQPKSGGWILVLRSKKKPAWNNADIGVHLQVKAEGDLVRFRCVVNNRPTRQAWVPPQCRHGGVNDWSW